MTARYQINELIDPSQPIPKEHLAKHSSDGMLIFTAVLGVLIGVSIVFIGKKGRVLWMRVWGTGLVAFSIFLGLSLRYNWQLMALRNWFAS